MEDHCIFCGDVIPEGRMVCPHCEEMYLNYHYDVERSLRPMINWKVRFRNKDFWIHFIPAVLLLVQLVLDLFGVKYDFGELGNKLLAIVDVVFVILALLGVVNDPTTAGVGDSTRALGYTVPYDDAKENGGQ